MKRRRDEITSDEVEKYLAAVEDPYVLRRLRCRCQYVAEGSGLAASDFWGNLLQWLIDNWPTILQILLSLLMFLGDEEA